MAVAVEALARALHHPNAESLHVSDVVQAEGPVQQAFRAKPKRRCGRCCKYSRPLRRKACGSREVKGRSNDLQIFENVKVKTPSYTRGSWSLAIERCRFLAAPQSSQMLGWQTGPT